MFLWKRDSLHNLQPQRVFTKAHELHLMHNVLSRYSAKHSKENCVIPCIAGGCVSVEHQIKENNLKASSDD